MVAWQTDQRTPSFLSERGNFRTWERSSASDCAFDCASECASASSTQSPSCRVSDLLNQLTLDVLS